MKTQGSIPGPTQWVKDLVLQVADTAWIHVARWEAGMGSAVFTPNLEISICHGGNPKKKKKKKKKSMK